MDNIFKTFRGYRLVGDENGDVTLICDDYVCRDQYNVFIFPIGPYVDMADEMENAYLAAQKHVHRY